MGAMGREDNNNNNNNNNNSSNNNNNNNIPEEEEVVVVVEEEVVVPYQRNICPLLKKSQEMATRRSALAKEVDAKKKANADQRAERKKQEEVSFLIHLHKYINSCRYKLL